MPATRPSYGGRRLSADMPITPGQVRRGWLAAARRGKGHRRQAHGLGPGQPDRHNPGEARTRLGRRDRDIAPSLMRLSGTPHAATAAGPVERAHVKAKSSTPRMARCGNRTISSHIVMSGGGRRRSSRYGCSTTPITGFIRGDGSGRRPGRCL